MSAGHLPDLGRPIPTTGSNSLAVRGEGHRPKKIGVPPESEQFPTVAGLPDLGRMILTARYNKPAIRRKGHGGHTFQVASELLQGQVNLPLPIVPFKTSVRGSFGLFQQLPQPTDVVLLPSLLGYVQVGHIEEAASFGSLRLGSQALLLLGLLGGLSFPLRRLGGETLLFLGITGSAGLNRLPGADGDSDYQSRRHHRRGPH